MHVNVITNERLMKCKYCEYAEDTAKLWGKKCPKAKQHSFSVPYTSMLNLTPIGD